MKSINIIYIILARSHFNLQPPQFEAVLKERNDLEGRLQQEKQVHLRRLAALKEQINIARLSFGSIINMLQNEPNIDNEVSSVV